VIAIRKQALVEKEELRKQKREKKHAEKAAKDLESKPLPPPSVEHYIYK
jgi:hypothetical protein